MPFIRSSSAWGELSSVSSLGQYRSGPLVLEDAALCTDLYELTMAASYLREGMGAPATFSLFVRKLPSERSFLVAAGLEDTLRYLEGFRFSPRAIRQLERLGRFERNFLNYLATVRFTGSVRAMREGTPVFADEPLLEVTAPIAEAQLVESVVLNICHLQTLQASKAVRCVLAAAGRPIAEFGLRRTHGTDAALKAVRAGFLAGVEQTSNVLAGLTYGVPLTGTMAHSYVCAFEHELDAFQAFGRAAPAGTILLLDTYDTVVAAHRAVRVARELAARGGRLVGVRLDSGDLVALSRDVRRVLDAARLHSVKIVASGNLDEHAIARCVAAGAPIDMYGVGTRMTVSADAPYLDMAYKLVHYDDRDVLKLSPGKETWAGAKQVYRRRDADGVATEDLLAMAEEPPPPGAEPLLTTVMEGGKVTRPLPTLPAARAYCAAAVGTLPETARRLQGTERYRVTISAALAERQHALRSGIIASSQSLQADVPIVV
jgi:nicotinate phosphoribosyltransferase